MDDIVFASGSSNDQNKNNSISYSASYYITLYNEEIGFYGRTFVSKTK
jgi:hypothetical protein